MPELLRIQIEVDNTAARSAIAETNKQLDGLTTNSTRSAQNTGNVFQRMATQIAQSVRSIGGAPGTNTSLFRSIEESARLAGTGASNSMRGMVANITASLRGLESSNGSFLNISSGAEAAAAKASSAMAAAASKMKAEIASVSGEIVVNAKVNPQVGSANGSAGGDGVGIPVPAMVSGRVAPNVPYNISRDLNLAVSEWDIRKANAKAEGLWRAGSENMAMYDASSREARESDVGTAQFNSAAAMREQAVAQRAMAANMKNAQAAMVEEQAAAAKLAAEQEALANSSKKTGESFTGGMLKGMVYFEALQKGIEVIKTLTFESAKYAAQTKMYETAMYAVALANGVSAKSAKEAEQAMRKLNIGTQEAGMSVSRMIQAGIPLQNARTIADMGRNLAISVPGMTSSDVTANIVRGVQTGETENLRTLGINVNFERSYQQYAKAHHEATSALTEEERMTARLTTVLQEHSKTAGMYEAAMGDVGKQMSSLPRLFDDAKNAIGDKLVPALGLLVTTASWVLDSIAKHPMVAKGVTLAGGAATGAAIGAGIGAVAGPTAVPGALIGAGVGATVAATSIVYDDLTGPGRRAKEAADRKAKEEKDLAGNAAARKKAQDDQKATSDQQRAAEIAKKSAEEYRKTVESLRQAVAKAQAEELTGYKKLNAERDNELAKLSRKHQLTKETTDLVNAELAAKIRSESRKDIGKLAEGFEAEWDKAAKDANTQFSTHLSYTAQTESLDVDSLVRHYDESTRRSIELSRNMQLESLRTIDARSIAGKLEVEQKRFAIEQEYLQKSSVAQIEAIRIQTEGQVALLEQQRAIASTDQEKTDITQRISVVQQIAARQAAAIQDVFLDSSQAARTAAINNQTEIVQAGIQKQFDSFKQASYGVFDALLVKSESVWQAMANSLKNAFLTVMKEIVTSSIAKQLTAIFTPQSAGAATSGGTMGTVRSWWERMTSAPRAQSIPATTPPFVGNDSGVDVGAYDPEDPGAQYNRFIDAPAGAMSMAAFAMPGTTPPFMPAAAGSPYGAAGNGGGGMLGQFSQLAGLSKLLKGGWHGLFGKSGGHAAGQVGSGEGDGLEGFGIPGSPEKDGEGSGEADGGMFSGGVGGLAGTALMMGGSMLAMDGWKRGGGKGMLEMTGGGAAIGYKFGGPWGAAVGAGVGALVGGLHWAFGAGSQEEQMKKHVKQLTGVTIDDKSFLSSMVAACKQATGGDIVSFVKSKAGMDMVESYASQTKQQFRNPFNVAQFNMNLSGGSVYEQASYTNGLINTPLSSLPGVGFSDIGSLSIGASSNITLQLDAEATTNVLTGQAANVIQNNPRMVAASNADALSQNYGTAAIGAVGNPTSIKP
jgi:hypothetical protein